MSEDVSERRLVVRHLITCLFTVKFHPLADLFPPMSDAEMAALTADIKANGLSQPITTLDGAVLDGRHRLTACERAKVRPRFHEFEGDDPLAFVLSVNMTRRHLTDSQRAMVAAKIANMPSHRPENKSVNLLTSQTKAAETLAISPSSVGAAVKVLRRAPKLAKQVAAGEISLNAAKKKLPPPPMKPKTTPPPPPSKILDETGWPIPTQLIPLFRRSQEVQDILTDLSAIKGKLRKAQESKDTLFAEVNFSSALSQLDQAWTDIKTAKPYAVCPTCQGQLPDHCALCKGRGMISEHRWNTCVTREDKEFRFKTKGNIAANVNGGN